MRPKELAAFWSRLGKLTQRPKERQALRRDWSVLQPLLEQTVRALGRFDARAVATTAHGMAKVGEATGWDAGGAVRQDVALRGRAVVGALNEQELANIAWAFA